MVEEGSSRKKDGGGQPYARCGEEEEEGEGRIVRSVKF